MIKLSLAAFVVIAVMSFSASNSEAQRPGINQDESKVPPYTLPDPLLCLDGTKVDSAKIWESKRRPEVLKLFQDHVYGSVPTGEIKTTFEAGEPWSVLDGKATRQEVVLTFSNGDKKVSASLLLTIPVLESEKPVPCFVGLNFGGNHTTTSDPRVAITTSWIRDKKKDGIKNHRASENGRGKSASRWPYEEIIAQGFAVGTMYCGDIDPDFDDGFTNGIHGLLGKPTKHQWGTISAWAWSLSRVLDYLETEELVDVKRVAVIGHSRLGKTALWAGATDQRFWLTVSNNSGCGGAALHRRKFGETVKVINTNFPHWFCDQFVDYNDSENEIPVDQHFLIALMAPRAVYVASATLDQWADPKGEFLAIQKSDPVFQLYDSPKFDAESAKPDNSISFQNRGYHLRSGKHDITISDWKQYLRFAKSLDE